MPRFNSPTAGTKTINKAGGEAHTQTPELELVSILLTSFANDSFYRSATDTFARLKELIKVCDKRFVAQAAIYARAQFGMRSITHCVASELARHISGEKWAKDFYTGIVYRPDDMMEILAYHNANNGKPTNQMKKGLAKAFDKFDKYSLAKYRGEGKSFKLVDVVNIVHPTPTEKNLDAIAALVKGDLKSFDTWESALSAAGQTASSEEEKADFKKEAWIKLIREKKIGYFALLRNLRNIIEQAPEVITEAIETLTNPAIIKKSLVLPFRYLTAFEEIQKLTQGKIVREVLAALNRAVDIAVDNVPKFDGETLVVLDVSGSMKEGGMGQKSPHIIGALFSAVLVKANNCDFMTFDNTAKYINLNPMDSTITIANAIPFTGGGTDFHSIFRTINKKYERIIILSDMQGWVGYATPARDFAAYKIAKNANPFVYSFDLKNYGSMQFPEPNVFALAGFSEKVFDVMKLMEQDKRALINEIKKVAFDKI
jgi:60 kDa SS-A/Ro ribonucleoprotein